MYSLARRVLSRTDPETAHDIALATLAAMSRSRALCALLKYCNFAARNPLPHTVMGIEFPTPIGLAAGLDKHGVACNALHAFGFGWLELGTVTPQPQPGNPRPRMFRLPQQRALINRMGFNSVGIEQFLRNLATVPPHIIKGINISKNAATSLKHAVDDYLSALTAVYAHADYVAINISSPNTRNLRNLQQQDALKPLLSALHRQRMVLADASGRRAPLVLKIAPDLDPQSLDHIAQLSREYQIDGIAASNTTLARTEVKHEPFAHEPGGLSGAPLAARATETIHHLFRNLQGEIPIIGIGGIDCAQRAIEKFHAGAELVQLYTGIIYRGPKLVGEITKRVKRESQGLSVQKWLSHSRK